MWRSRIEGDPHYTRPGTDVHHRGVSVG